MKPLIGIVVRPSKSESKQDIWCVYKKVSDAITKCGGIPIGIIPNITNNSEKNFAIESFNDCVKIINLCGGIICQGGDDFYDFDIDIVKYIYDINKPLLGICLGMQTMACTFDGLMIDINNLSHERSNEKYVHTVKLKPNSHLANILKTNFIYVNSRHKSKIIKTNLKVVGYSEDGIIEAVEDPNKKFFIGIQWHPESMIEYDILMNRLFSYFIQVCK